MATPPSESQAQLLHDQVARITKSSVLGGSEALRNLLAFLAEHATAHPGQPPREKEIAAAVFGRSVDFDPQNDSTVRVHTGRLRSKLAEYYIGEGAADNVVVEIPRGSYQLAFHLRGTFPDAESAPAPAPVSHSAVRFRPWLAGAVCLILVGVAAYFAGAFFGRPGTPRAEPALATFWRDFVSHSQPPLLIFGNPRFVGSDFSGMRYWNDSDDPREAVVDTFTSIGDLAGVFEVTRQLGVFGKQPGLKRAQLLTWDDAADRNLVIVGSPISIRALREHPFLEEFVFKDRTVEPRIGVGAIINKHPRPGEQSIYYGPDTRPYQFDYGVIAQVPGVNPGRRTLVLAGITSHGTQATAEFVCRDELVRKLSFEISRAGGGPSGAFECLIRVRVSGGVPVHPEILAVRVRR